MVVYEVLKSVYITRQKADLLLSNRIATKKTVKSMFMILMNSTIQIHFSSNKCISLNQTSVVVFLIALCFRDCY